ncbi:MAG: glycosyltransferase family 9 protein, partial [Minisyncoccales bacterium]
MMAPKEKIKKILLIRPDMIGDTALITPALSLLRQHFPNTNITLLIQSYPKELFQNHPDVNEIIIDKIAEGKVCNFLSFLRYVKEIKEKNFDLAIAFYNEFPYALLIRLAGIPYRIGDRSKIIFGWMYNVKVYQKWADLTKHEVEHNLELLKPLGINPQRSFPKLKILLSDEQKNYLKTFLVTNNINEKDLVVGINPGIGRTSRAWFPQRYAKVIDFLVENFSAKIIITGTEKDKVAVKEIKNHAKNEKSIIDLAGV